MVNKSIHQSKTQSRVTYTTWQYIPPTPWGLPTYRREEVYAPQWAGELCWPLRPDRSKSRYQTNDGDWACSLAYQIMPIVRIWCYKGSLITWTFVSLTTAKIKSLIFSQLNHIQSYRQSYLRLAVYCQSVRLGIKAADTQDQFIFQLKTYGNNPNVTSSLTRGWVCRLQ
jgi:hypothetical protein